LGGTDGPVALRLRALSAPVSALDAWNDIQRQPLRDDDDDDDDES
jgi:hypothetical protein